MVEPRLVEVHALQKALGALPSRRDLSSIDLQGELSALLKRTRAKVLSLDVFDTFLLRNGKSEARRFWELAERGHALLPKKLRAELTPADLYVARCTAMQIAYRTRPAVRGCREGHIEDVLAMQARAIGAPKKFAQALEALEIEYEIENLSVNEPLVEAARGFANQRGTVVMVSDMYLGSATIERIAQGVAGEVLWVAAWISSADEVISKRSGLMYAHLHERLGVRPRELVHVGDSLLGDVRRAREAGSHAVHFPISDEEWRAREADLQEFIRERAEEGLDVTRWAKI